jgi:ParB family chromosome partitioning protein
MTQTVPFVIKEIPLSDIVFPTEEMRSQVNFENLDELSRSIRQVGLMNPISVRTKDGKYELIAGFRRTKACEMAGMQTVPARIFESSDSIADLQKAHENLFREEVNAVDEANYIKVVMQKNNYKLEDMALLIHKSVPYVSRRLKMLDGPENVREALKDGRINLSVAEELCKVKSDEDRNRLMFLVINNGATVDVVRSWRIQSEMNAQNGRPPTWEEQHANADGTPHDPSKMGNLIDDQGPQVSLTEEVKLFRTCQCCKNKTDEKDAKLLVLCPTCAGAIEPYLDDIKAGE